MVESSIWLPTGILDPEIEVRATSKEEAENMIDNVLLGCEYFVFNDKSEYKLKIHKMKWSDKIGKK